jgi:hypothetical protein
MIITVAHKDDALTVPTRALKRQGNDQTVEVVLPDGKTKTRTVRIGIASEADTEIVDGLSEDEQVLVPTTSSRAPTTNARGGFGGPGFAGPGGGVFIGGREG